MLNGLRTVNKFYPLLNTRVEESWEHVILGKEFSSNQLFAANQDVLSKTFTENLDSKVSSVGTLFTYLETLA